MKTFLPTRKHAPRERGWGISALSGVFAGVVGLGLAASSLSAQRAPVFHAPPPRQAAPPPQRPQGGQQNPQNQGPRNQNGTLKSNPHLTEWMSKHRDMPLEQQQKALESEPGFRELPAQTQQRMREQLGQLNSMTPADRERILQHNEQMERMTGQQRQQVKSALLQLGSLPPDRSRAVARAFRDLRAMPEGQRQQYMNSPAYRSQFSDQERGTVSNLMSVEPYLPGRRTNVEAPPQQ